MKKLYFYCCCVACFLGYSVASYAGIYLVYGSNSSSAPVAVVDDQTALGVDDGYLSPHAFLVASNPVISGYVGRAMPLAFVPNATRPVGGVLPAAGIYMAAPTATSSPELSRVIQSGHAWSSYQTGNAASGLGLVYSPSYGGYVSGTQRSARGNRARAQAFRLDYYK